MSVGISFTINDDGTIEILKKAPKSRKKGKSLLELVPDYTVIDIETTGLYPGFDEIIEIGALKVRDNEIIDSFNSLVYNRYIDTFITELTGITTEMTLKAPKIKKVLRNFLTFIEDDILIAHNANFDINFIYDEVEMNFDREFKNNFIDTLRLARKAYPEFKTHRIQYLKDILNLDNFLGHRSLEDCYSAFTLYQKCKEKIIYENIDLNPRPSYIKYSEIRAHDSAIFDENHPLFNKNCVFTGTLEKMVRREAAQVVANIGGFVGSGITSKTDYLIVGVQDYSRFVDGKESSKMKKVKALIDKGRDIRIISENEFYEMALDIVIND